MRDEGRLKPLAEMVFIGEIAHQAAIAKAAAKHTGKLSDYDRYEVWGAIHVILASAGIVSKILWPIKKASSARGKVLRELLNVDELSPLSKRKFRDHFEHYDERVEEWFEGKASAGYTDYVIDPFPPTWGWDLDTRHRVYDPLNNVLRFRGESMDLGAILKALEEIRLKCGNFVLIHAD
jgi:hypothetical protein